MEKSSLKLISNIMLKSKYKKTWESRYSYMPFDLLPSTYSDRRSEGNLSEFQKKQKRKRLFAAERVLDKKED